MKQLSVLVFETRGKDGFRVLGKQQPSSAHAGQSLSYLRVTPPGEALKSNIRKVDLNIHHPEHHTFVVVPCMHVIAASLFSPPKKLAVRNGDDRTRYSCPQLCCSDAHRGPSPRSDGTVTLSTPSSPGAEFHPMWLREIPRPCSAAAPISGHLSLLRSA